MPHLPLLQSDIRKFITGVENVHCTFPDPDRAKDSLTSLFGPAEHVDGSWTEFKVAGLDVAVTSASETKFVITFTVERLEELRDVLIERKLAEPQLQTGDYGNFIEISPEKGFFIHFFEPKKKCDSIERS